MTTFTLIKSNKTLAKRLRENIARGREYNIELQQIGCSVLHQVFGAGKDGEPIRNVTYLNEFYDALPKGLQTLFSQWIKRMHSDPAMDGQKVLKFSKEKGWKAIDLSTDPETRQLQIVAHGMAADLVSGVMLNPPMVLTEKGLVPCPENNPHGYRVWTERCPVEQHRELADADVIKRIKAIVDTVHGDKDNVTVNVKPALIASLDRFYADVSKRYAA